MNSFSAAINSMAARRAVLILALAQATAMICNSIIIVTSGLTGQMLAEHKGWATLPLGFQFIATMLTTFPASFFMKWAGRKAGFLVGAMIGIVGGLVMAAATYLASFWLFAIGNTIFGISAAFTLFYRFAAAEAADEAFRPKAISLVMAGGVISALLGPYLAHVGQEFFQPYLFTGGFIFIAVLSILIVIFLLPLHLPQAVDDANIHDVAPSRRLAEIILQPRALSAIVAAMLGYGVMSFVMTATPLAMIFCGFDLKTGISFVIQGHVLAMFAPSFVTGHIIKRFGEFRVMVAGVLCYVGCIGIGLAGIDIHHFWLALVLLGLGWNFLYIAGTSQLTQCYRSSERTKIQAFNDCMVFSCVALCSFIAGTVEQIFGWNWVLYGAGIPVIVIAVALLIGWRRNVVTA